MVRLILLTIAWALGLAAHAAPGAREVSIDYQGLRLNALYQSGSQEPVILIVHGTLGHNEMDVIQGLRSALTEEGFGSLSINLGLGVDDRHGSYDCSQPHRHQHGDAVGELQQWVDWLKELDQNTIIMLGHSRGGNQLARYLADKPDAAVKAGVLLAPIMPRWQQQQADYEKRFGVDLAPVLMAAEEEIKLGRGEQLMPNVGLLYCDPGAVSANSFASYYRYDPDFYTPALFDRIHLPLLVIEGSEDQITFGLAEAFHAAPGREQQELVTVEGAGHFFRDLYAYDVVEAMVEFLENQL
jgi:pimeloyl-ACP methyl ester carboxylesterase